MIFKELCSLEFKYKKGTEVLLVRVPLGFDLYMTSRLRGGSKHTTVMMKQNSENFKGLFLQMHHTTFRDLKVGFLAGRSG